MRLSFGKEEAKAAGTLPKLLRTIIILCCAYASWATVSLAQTSEPWMQQVNAVIGTPGKLNPDGVLSWNLIRPDLPFQLRINASNSSESGDRDGDRDDRGSGDRFSLLPAMAAGNVNFKQQSNGQVLMTFEFQLRQREVNTFVSTLEARSIRVTAIHNHYLLERPRIMYVHADGLGDPVQLAKAAVAAWNSIQAKVDPDGESDSDDTVSGLDPEQIGDIIGGTADALDGIVDATVGRKESVVDQFSSYSAEMPSEMGPNSDFEFQPLGHGRAAVVGEVCVRPNEANAVIKVLRSAGFMVTALHNHFLAEEPRLFFVHLQAAGDANHLAQVIRQALNQTNAEFK